MKSSIGNCNFQSHSIIEVRFVSILSIIRGECWAMNHVIEIINSMSGKRPVAREYCWFNMVNFYKSEKQVYADTN